MRNFYIVALPSAIFCYDVQRALIAQLDRVQVSEACGVGSSPAERTNTYYKNNNLYVLWRKFGVIHILNKKNPAKFCGVYLS